MQRTGNTRKETPNYAIEDEECLGLRLVGMLLQCAEAVAMDNLDLAASILPEITHLASPFGSPAMRVAAYFSDALQSRLMSSWLGMYAPLPSYALEPFSQRLLNAFQAYNAILPLVKFSHFTANQAIVQAVSQVSRVHIIDLDIMQGLQWPGLFHLLSTCSTSPPSVRITGFGSCARELAATGERLSVFSASLGLAFEYTGLVCRAGEVRDLARLKLQGGETVIVNWVHHYMYDVTGSDAGLLKLLHSVKPRLITMVEQDVSHGDGGGFLRRFVNALHYYSALFDALGSMQDSMNQDRNIAEQQVLGREIKNIVGGGGRKRSGEMVVERWGAELGKLGFRGVSLRGSAADQARLLLGMYPWQEGYSVVEEGGCLRVGWKDLALLTASAWEPCVM
ncbi:protein SCARECROW [Amborella trichopoda]|nr:protein SCARECROW [Amborella trichopoda]|eukprot:XP_006853952.2 protein SCARECROW [Amborella trichopoda]